jgi:hypothetical protein
MEVWYNVPPVYRRPEDEGWAGLSVAQAKSAEEVDIITVDNDDEDDGGEDSGAGLDWSAFDYYSGR